MHCTGCSGQVPAGIDFQAGRWTERSPAAHVSRGVPLSAVTGADSPFAYRAVYSS
jgi:hypothetical protein